MFDYIVILLVKVYLTMLDHKIIQYYNQLARSASDTETLITWKSKGLSDEKIKSPTALGNILIQN